MSLPYCSLHERLFLSSMNEWIDFSQENVIRVKDLSTLPPSSEFEFSQLKILAGACDRCAKVTGKPPLFFFLLLLLAFFVGISMIISCLSCLSQWFMSS